MKRFNKIKIKFAKFFNLLNKNFQNRFKLNNHLLFYFNLCFNNILEFLRRN